jgi:predicted amidophosphoribosyltransferase
MSGVGYATDPDHRTITPVLAVTDLLLPRSCPCGAQPGASHLLCSACQQALVGAGVARLVRPYPAPRGLPVCAAGAEYAGRVRRAVIAYKERGRRDLAAPLAAAAVAALALLPVVIPALRRPGARVLFVPVPASRAGWRARGVDHVAVIVQQMLRQLGPVFDGRLRARWTPLLMPVRRVADQAGLSGAARAANVAGSLRVRGGAACAAARGSPAFVLVDDVLTSGATLAEAARAMRGAGLQPSGAVVVAGVRRTGQEAADSSVSGLCPGAE